MSGESYAAIDAFLMLNPPVAVTLSAWLAASKSGMPASSSEKNEQTVIPA